MSSLEPAGDELIAPKMRSFMYGQFANLFKFAFWWVALSPLLYALCDGSTAIGVGRIVYNSALCLASPFGPLLIEKVPPRKILLWAAGLRFFVWCVLLPINWIVFDTNFTDSKSSFGVYALMVVMLMLDGISVGLSSVLDIDMMGVDIVAGFLGYEVTEDHRNAFNSRQELFFSVCFIIFAPGVSFIGLGLKKAFEHWDSASSSITLNQVESGTLSAIFFVVFFIATILQLVYFLPLQSEEEENCAQERGEGDNDTSKSLLPLNDGDKEDDEQQQQQQDNLAAPSGVAQLSQDDLQNPGDQGPPPTTCDQICGVFTELKESFILVISHRAILFRLIFFGFELAFEDASIVVLAAQMGIRVPWMGGGGAVSGSIWTACIVAAGKIGAAIASYLMMEHYKPPENIMGHTRLFIFIGLSTLVILGVPLAFDGYSSGNLSEDAARAIVFVSFMLYFFLSTLPKLGLMSLLQTMVSQVENGHRAFAFIAILATTIDSVVIMILSLLFTSADKQDDKAFSHSLWITCYVFLGHGILETIFGPVLVLGPAADDQKHAEEQEKIQKEQEQQHEQEKQRSQDREDTLTTDANASSQGDGMSVGRRPSSPGDDANNMVASQYQAPTGSYSARGVAMPTAVSPRPSGLMMGTTPRGQSASRLGGNTPRGVAFASGIPMPNRAGASGLGGQSSPRGDGDGGGGGTSIRQHVMGTGIGGSVVAASMVIPSRNIQSNLEQDNDATGSYVRQGRSQRSFLGASNLGDRSPDSARGAGG